MALDPNAPDLMAPRPGISQSRPTPKDLQLKIWPLDELLALHAAVEAVLPVKDLRDMDLARELVMQVQSLQQLQQTIAGDDDIPVNQRAQVANSLSAALVNLVKLQTDVYTAERFKRVEQFLIDYINSMHTPEEREFQYGRYEKLVLEKSA